MRYRSDCILTGIVLLLNCLTAVALEPEVGSSLLRFTPLVKLDGPEIVAASAAYPGGGYEVDNIIDGLAEGGRQSEYSSAGKGTETFIDFDFGTPRPIAAFKHVDRFDPATVDTAELVFSNQPDFESVLARVAVKHANTRGGVTFLPFSPVTARYARWQVTAVKSYSTVGGSEISFFLADPKEPIPIRTVVELAGQPALLKEDGRLMQPFEVTIRYPYAEPAEATLKTTRTKRLAVSLRPGSQTIDLLLPAVDTETTVTTTLEILGQTVAEVQQLVKPVRQWSLYFLSHSHVDIGYTHLQTEVEQKQWEYFQQSIDLARRTADYPPEARFKWNSEVLWAVDGYLKQAPAQQQEEFIEAVRKGWIHLDALYGNELTALCRPEELFRLLDCARRLSRQYDLVIDSAMISDVPGYTWGIVPALAQSGVKYFSVGPNHVHRIGYTLTDWGDRPFYWVSPSGEDKVLFWMAGKAYSWFHASRLSDVEDVKPGAIFDYLNELSESGYLYDMVQVRYSIGGDNGPPDANLPEFVKAWNAKYVYPKMTISTTSELFEEFEARYGDKLPEIRGDFTPYWEDGAGSSARETAATRNASERLVQAEALWAMLDPRQYPCDDFYAAWRNAILYNEHTWGAHCSISQPDDQFTKDQWAIKQAFAVDAASQSRKLLASALAGRKSAVANVTAIDVYNTASWPRTDLVVLPREVPVAGEAVEDSDGGPVPSQRLSSGELAFLATSVPPFGAKRFHFSPGDLSTSGDAMAEGATVDNRRLRLVVDEKTGAIASLTAKRLSPELVAADAQLGLNEYFYVPSRDPKDALRNGQTTITVKEPGPLVASLLIESEAPGCRKLTRELRLVAGFDHVDLINVVDKEPIRTKESVHFGFAFDVPDGVMRMDTPWAVVRPEADQLSGACKNYLTVGRWVDISNGQFGLTWATVDAPLIEIGQITVDVLPSVFDPDNWLRHLDSTGTFYSYVMNNYWETNYKADQQGPTTFRYAIRPHGGFDAAAAARFGLERSRPLIAAPVDPARPLVPSLLRVEPEGVIVTSLKPSEDGQALMVRLFNPSDTATEATLSWSNPIPRNISLSSPFEEPGAKLAGPVKLPAYAIITLRAEVPDR